MMGDDLYQEVILDHAKRPRNKGCMCDSTHCAQGYNPLCGDEVKVCVNVSDGMLSCIRFDGHGRDAANRAMERAALREQLDLKKGTAILATVGSTAPFVGLVGTVFGIINAFAGMAESGSGGLASVSGGIAEALVTTALGIAVAIIGVWLFNFFNNRVELIVNDMSVSVQEFADWVEKVLVEKAESSEPGTLAQKD